MSVWTHVAGAIRIDGCISVDEISYVRIFEEIFGKILKYDSPSSMWEEAGFHKDRFTPYGSEGGIEYHVYVNPDGFSMAKYAVLIIGDLRDYSNTEEIVEWFNKILYGHDLLIRDAVLSIDVEGIERKVVSYDPGKGEQAFQNWIARKP